MALCERSADRELGGNSMGEFMRRHRRDALVALVALAVALGARAALDRAGTPRPARGARRPPSSRSRSASRRRARGA
jgi:hypothetical protein